MRAGALVVMALLPALSGSAASTPVATWGTALAGRAAQALGRDERVASRGSEWRRLARCESSALSCTSAWIPCRRCFCSTRAVAASSRRATCCSTGPSRRSSGRRARSLLRRDGGTPARPAQRAELAASAAGRGLQRRRQARPRRPVRVRRHHPEADPTPFWLNENGVFRRIGGAHEGPAPNVRGPVGFVNGDGRHAFFSVEWKSVDNSGGHYYVSREIVRPTVPAVWLPDRSPQASGSPGEP